jgi:5-formyltetrahydrofolate cyclo-ligase
MVPDDAAAPEEKADLRTELLTARRARSDADLAAARAAVRAHVLTHIDGVARVAAYEPLATEPGSTELLTDLHARGISVLVPVTLPDRDLDWSPWSPAGRGAPLGTDAIAAIDLVLVPALAVARDGTRLGRGGGSYDRALARVPRGTFTCVVLNDVEVLDAVPAAPHDRRVSAAVTEQRLLRF